MRIMKTTILSTGAGLAAGLCIIVIMALAVPAAAKDIHSKAGTTAFSFLKLGVGAKAVAMGGAFTGLADDATALYYNPGATVYLEGTQLLAGYHNYVLDIQSGFLAATRPVSAMGSREIGLGAFISYMNFGDFTRMSVNGVPEGEFSGGDILFGLNASIMLIPEAAVGLNVKYMHEAAAGYGSDALAADVGLAVRLPDTLTSAGLMLYNLGGVVSGYTDHKDKLPMGVRLGVSHSLRELPLVVAVDGVVPNDNDPYVNIGTEFYKLEPLYLRAGYSLFGENYKTGSDSDGWGGFVAGFGLDYERWHFAYAFLPYLDLGYSHRVTISGGF